MSLVLIIAQLFNAFAMAGLPIAALRLYFDDDVGPLVVRRLYAPATVLAIASSAAGLLAVLALRACVGLGHLWPALLVLPVLTLPTSLGVLSGNILQVQKRATAFAIVTVMRGGANTGLGIVAVVLAGRSVSSYLAGYVAGVVVVAAVAVLLVRPLAEFPSRALLKRAVDMGLPTISAGVGVFALAMADRFVVRVALTAGDVGRYQLAYAVGGLVFTVLVSVSFAWLPQVFSAGSQTARIATIRRLGAVIQGFAMVLIAGVSLMSPVVLPTVLPSSYRPLELARLASVVAFGAVTYVPYIASRQVMLWKKETRPMAWITPAAVAVEVITGAALVMPFGLMGVAVASGFAYVAQAGLALRAAARVATIGWLSCSWLLASVPGAVCWILGMALPGGSLGEGSRIALTLVLVAGSVWAAWSSKGSDRPSLPSRRRRRAR